MDKATIEQTDTDKCSGYSQSKSKKDTPSTTFLNKFDIDLDPYGNQPILNPFQFLYPKGDHHVKEIVSYKFSKSKLAVTCPTEDYIFTFYNTLRHIAASFNILLRPLHEVTKETGTCQLSHTNCIRYKHSYDAMSTALHLKLTTNDYFKGFPQAMTYVHAAHNNSDGFKLLYRILELIHPQLRAEKGGIHKTIEAPNYSDIEDDNIYTFMTRYKNYLLYEALSPEKRQYNKKEQAMYVMNTLKSDDRFTAGIEYVKNTLQAYQRERSMNQSCIFPIDLEIDEIGITIDERSPDYVVGELATTTPTITRGVINAFNRRSFQQNQNNDKNHRSKNIDKSIACKGCGGRGHCITNPENICFIMAKHHICSNFLAQDKNLPIIKANTYRYKKDRKEKAQKSKFSSKVDTFIRNLEDKGEQHNITPMISLAQALASSTDSDSNHSHSDTDDDSNMSK